MLTYRVHIYTRAMVVTAEATTLALSLSKCTAELRIKANPPGAVEKYLPDLRSTAASLCTAVDKFLEALPSEVREQIRGHTNLMRHLCWIDYWLGKRSPDSCMGDPVDIVAYDLPDALGLFEEWYERQSPTDSILGTRLEPHITNGQLNAALREAWPVFKTRMVEVLSLIHIPSPRD